MSLILNIESATDVCSVALARDGEVIGLAETEEPYKHSEQLTLLIREVMDRAGLGFSALEAVAISSGPGSYTSLRVGVSVAKGICFSRSLPLITIGTLEALFHQALRLKGDAPAFYIPMIDARRMEVYSAVFDHRSKQLTPVTALVIEGAAFREYLETGRPVYFFGNGAGKCRPHFDHPNAHFLSLRCQAGSMAPLAKGRFEAGHFADLAHFEPFYLKRPNITEPKKIW